MRTFVLALAVLAATGSVRAQGRAAADETPAYYFLLGRHLEDQGKIDEAIAAHRRAIELRPRSAELHAELAGLYSRQERLRDAVETAETALELDPANREAHRILGNVYSLLADQQKVLSPGEKPVDYTARAVASLEKARRDNVFDPALELSLGRLYIQTGAYAKAVTALERAIEDAATYVEGTWLLSLAYEGAKQLERAIAILQDGPMFYRGRVRLAELLEGQQRWKEAAEAYAEAQAINPRALDLIPRYAVALVRAGEAAQATEILQRLVSKGRDEDPVLLYLLAVAQQQSDDLPGAEATARRLRAIAPDDPRGMYVMAQILDARKDTPGAERVLRELLARDPADAPALNFLGYMFAERGERLDEAIELVQRALKLEPDNPSYLDSLGWAYFQQGRLDLADEPLTTAAARLPSNSVVQDHLGDLRFRQNRFDEAVAAWERSLAGDGESIDRERIEDKLRNARARMQ